MLLANGHKDLVEFFISKGADDWNEGMQYAAIGGHKDLVEFFISKGLESNPDYLFDWVWGMRYASEGGHKDLVEFFKQKLAME